jgi:hypothetical protein
MAQSNLEPDPPKVRIECTIYKFQDQTDFPLTNDIKYVTTINFPSTNSIEHLIRWTLSQHAQYPGLKKELGIHSQEILEVTSFKYLAASTISDFFYFPFNSESKAVGIPIIHPLYQCYDVKMVCYLFPANTSAIKLTSPTDLPEFKKPVVSFFIKNKQKNLKQFKFSLTKCR